MKKITEAELSRRVSSLREKLISEEIRPFGSHDESITRDPGVDPSITLSKMLPALKDVTRLTTHNGQVVAVNSDGLIRGVYDSPGSWKVGQGMPAVLQNVTVPAAKPIFTKDDGTNAEPEGFVRPPPGVILDKDPEAPAVAVTAPVAPQTPIVGTDLPPLDPAAAVGQNGAGQSAPAFSPAASDAAFKQAMANLNSPQSAAKVSTPAAVPVDPRDGPTGQALARMGISKQNRLDQAFVDRMLGAGKYKAGSAESNLALLKTKPPAGDTIDVPNQIGKAPPLGTSQVQKDAKGQYWTSGNPSRLLTPDEMKRFGLKESVTYADDQTLARIVSLGRR